MPELYLLDTSGSRKSSLTESVSSNPTPDYQNSTFPLSPKNRKRFAHRRLGSDGIPLPRILSYFPQIPAGDNIVITRQELKTDGNGSYSESFLGRISRGRRIFDWRWRAIIPWLAVVGIVMYLTIPRTQIPESVQSTSNLLPKLTANDPHPMKKIIKDAQASWKNMQRRRSKSYAEAVMEYRRRYKIDPPNGFEKWFAFAQGHDHLPIDEYDSMMEQLSRFRKMDRRELHSRTKLIGETSGFGLIEMKDGKIDFKVSSNLSYATYTNNDHENHEFKLKDGRIYNRWATSDRPLHKSVDQTQTFVFAKLIEKVARHDPTLFRDMTLAINEHFEPRVVIPWGTQSESRQDGSDSVAKFEEDAWTAFQKACPPDSEAPNRMNASQQSHLDFAIQSPAPIKEIYCNNPELHSEQGLFFSDTAKLSGLFPIFSQSTAHGFGDIVIPSYLYIKDPYKTRQYNNEPVTMRSIRGTTTFTAVSEISETDPRKWKEWNVRWEDKKNEVYWRGLLRDGGDKPAGFQSNFGRHRMVKLFGSLIPGSLETVISDLRPLKRNFLGWGLSWSQHKLGIREGVERSFLNLKTMDVAYLAEEQCRESCQAFLKENYRLKMWEPFGAAKFFKWSLDLDGIGFSAKFLNLLQIGTVVVKQTIYQEYYSDWLVPWVHYIPLSTKGSEMYNIWNYFLGRDEAVMTKEKKRDHSQWEVTNHEETLKQIGSDGLRWSQSHSREIDWEIYSYRLLIEWNRLWNIPE